MRWLVFLAGFVLYSCQVKQPEVYAPKDYGEYKQQIKKDFEDFLQRAKKHEGR